jgi:uncharacterized protein YmfQ (DUF2313 family)
VQFDVIKKLLPRGVAFGPEAKRLYVLLYGVSMEFDRVKSRALDVLTEVPGNLSERLDSWAKILEISGSDEEKKQGVSAKLVATGGQSPEYLLSILKKYRVQIRLEPDRGRHRMRVIGALDSISEFTLRVPEIKTGGRRINAPLRSWKRDEALIEGFETLKHAETEARYHLWTE